jgi:hypothetical protein
MALNKKEDGDMPLDELMDLPLDELMEKIKPKFSSDIDKEAWDRLPLSNEQKREILMESSKDPRVKEMFERIMYLRMQLKEMKAVLEDGVEEKAAEDLQPLLLQEEREATESALKRPKLERQISTKKKMIAPAKFMAITTATLPGAQSLVQLSTQAVTTAPAEDQQKDQTESSAQKHHLVIDTSAPGRSPVLLPESQK